MNKLLTHLQKTPYNLSGLAREAGVNPQMLHDAVKGRKPLPASASWNIIWQLAPVVIDGWIITRDENVLFVERSYPGSREVETIDHGDHFEYRISVSRDVLTDEIDLQQFIQG